MTTPETALANVLAEHAIARQIVRFGRAMDDRDWETIREITFADVESDVGTGVLHGVEPLIAVIESFLSACGTTQHFVGSMLIDVDGSTAQSRAYVRDMHLGIGECAELTFSTIGDYHDSWALDGETWRLRRRIKHNRGTIGTLAVFGIEDQR